MALKKFTSTNEPKSLSRTEELGIVVSTLRMDIVSKLTFFDTQKFIEIIANTFKDIPVENLEDQLLKTAIVECYNELNLCPNDRQVFIYAGSSSEY